jgi:hypothetical protein
MLAILPDKSNKTYDFGRCGPDNTMSIKQFNGEWIAREDRIVFRFNTKNNEAYSFWLTRMIVRGLIEGSQQLGVNRFAQEHPPEVAQAMQHFEKQATEQGLIYNESYEGGVQQPLGQEPVLIVGLRMTQNQDQTAVELEMPDQRRITLQMPLPMFLTMILLLQKLQAHAQWGLIHDAPQELSTDAQVTPGAGVQLH